jgi:hypothetical protein
VHVCGKESNLFLSKLMQKLFGQDRYPVPIFPVPHVNKAATSCEMALYLDDLCFTVICENLKVICHAGSKIIDLQYF